MTVPPDDSADRLREPPSERFAGTAHLFDLAEALRKLRSEDHPPKDGHRQITILHRAPVGHVLFAFEPGGRLAEHSARGAALFQKLCYQCHPAGNSGLGPALNDKPLPEAAIRTQIREGVGAMPSFGADQLTDEEVDAIADYVQEMRATPATFSRR